MVSRRKILSRSRDDLHMDSNFQQPEDEEDVWYQKDKLYKDHIQEVLDKWTQIDDEIWAKVIVLERNRRVAKAYARAPVLTVNGSDDGFDGFRIGLCGFENPMRDQKTEEFKRHIGHGVKIKMDDAGNILIKRLSKCNVYVKNTGQPDENAIGNEVLKLQGCALEPEKPFKLFDMKKFQSNVNRELRRAYPDRRRLECQCLSAIAFVKSEPELLECPIWVLIINVVAMDMLKSKLPPVQRMVDIKNRPRIPIPDEDPYSVAGNGSGSSGSSGFAGTMGVAATREQLLLQSQHHAQRRSEKPPKLPPRENLYPHNIPKPDYDDAEDDSRLKPFTFSRGKEKSKNNNKKYDDPYYCGLRARVPNFASKSKSKEAVTSKRFSVSQQQQPPPLPPTHQHLIHPHHMHNQPMWHTRSFESGIDVDQTESPYNQIYGRLRIPTRGYIPSQPRTIIGLCGFENPMRDQKTEDLKRHIGHGVKIKMDNAGNILIKRLSKCNVYIKNGGQDEENAIGNEILRMPGYAIEPEKPLKLFDMKKFQSNVNRELRRAYPDRRRLEYQCISAIAFVKSELQLLDCPIWVLIINIVAIDMLKSKLPPVQRAIDIKNRPRIPIPDEDPYSIAGNGDGSSRNLGLTDTIGMAPSLLLQGQHHFPRRSEKPPKLPPRENWYSHNIPQPDYDDTANDSSGKLFSRGKEKSKNKDTKYDDPYYCGLRARVPNFVSKSKRKESITSKRFSVIHHQIPPPLQTRHSHYTHQHHLHHQPMWQTRSFESGIDVEPTESPYQIYGFLRPSARVYNTSTINQARAMYVGQWN